MSPHRKCTQKSLDGNLDTRKGLLFQATSSKVYAEPSRNCHKQQALGIRNDEQFLFCRLDNAKYNALTLSLNLYSFCFSPEGLISLRSPSLHLGQINGFSKVYDVPIGTFAVTVSRQKRQGPNPTSTISSSLFIFVSPLFFS